MKMGKRVGMRTRTREMAMEMLGEEGGVTPRKKVGMLIFLMVYLAVFCIIHLFRMEYQYF